MKMTIALVALILSTASFASGPFLANLKCGAYEDLTSSYRISHSGRGARISFIIQGNKLCTTKLVLQRTEGSTQYCGINQPAGTQCQGTQSNQQWADFESQAAICRDSMVQIINELLPNEKCVLIGLYPQQQQQQQ